MSVHSLGFEGINMFRFMFILMFALAICACTNESSSSDKTMIKQVSCDRELPFSEKTLGNIKIKLFEPNDPNAPDIWQGPVCFSVNGAECGLDISLIKGVELGNDNHVVVSAFSGSIAHIYTVDPVTCTIVDYNTQ